MHFRNFAIAADRSENKSAGRRCCRRPVSSNKRQFLVLFGHAIIMSRSRITAPRYSLDSHGGERFVSALTRVYLAERETRCVTSACDPLLNLEGALNGAQPTSRPTARARKLNCDVAPFKCHTREGTTVRRDVVKRCPLYLAIARTTPARGRHIDHFIINRRHRR